MYISLWENSRGHPDNISFMQFSTKIDGFEQKDSQGFENSYNSYEQYPLEKFFIFTIYQNYTLALIERKQELGAQNYCQGCESVREKKSEIIWNAWKDVLFNALKVWKWGFVKSKKSEIRLKSEISHPCIVLNSRHEKWLLCHCVHTVNSA